MPTEPTVTVVSAPPVTPPAQMSVQDALYAPAAEAPVTPPVEAPVTPPVEAPVAPPVPPPTEPVVEPPVEPTPEEAALAVVPTEASAYTFTPPEGFTVDETAMGKFRDLALSKSMSQGEFNTALSLFTESLSQQAAAAQAAQLQTFQDTQTDWLRQINELPELQGQRREGTENSIGKLLDEYGTPEVREIMNVAGVGNNPALVKMFIKLAAALGEGAPPPQGKPPAAVKQVQSLVDVFYPSKES